MIHFDSVSSSFLQVQEVKQISSSLKQRLSCYRLQYTAMDCNRLPQIAADCNRLQLIAIDKESGLGTCNFVSVASNWLSCKCKCFCRRIQSYISKFRFIAHSSVSTGLNKKIVLQFIS